MKLREKFTTFKGNVGYKCMKLRKKVSSFYATTAGKVVLGSVAVAVTTAVTVGAIVLVKSNNSEEPTVQEAAVSVTETETTTKEVEVTTETTEAITEESTEETTEEETTVLEVIDIEDLEIVDESEVEVETRPVVQVEPETEPRVETTTPPTVTAPPSPVNEYACLVYGIDVSRWQGNIDWAQVKAAGYKFVMIKIGGRSTGSDGSLYIDAYFEQNIEGALSNGLQVGVYFFSQALNVREAQEEASLLINRLNGYNITYPVAFDWETSDGYRTYNANISNGDFTRIVNTFLSMVENAGYNGMVYGNWNDLYRFDIEGVAQRYKVWYARWWNKYQQTSDNYVAGEETPDVPFPYQMWQYKSTGRVPGINGNVDMNVAFFSYEGSGVPTQALTLNVTNKQVTTNEGTEVDLKRGVTSVNTAGKNVSQNVTYTIKNSSGTLVSYNEAKNQPGTYTVTYTTRDFTGAHKTATAKWIVRRKPVIAATYTSLMYFQDTDAEGINANDIAREVQALIDANITSVKDNEGNEIMNSLVVTYPTPLYLVNGLGEVLASPSDLTDAVLNAGEYTIGYNITDAKNLSNNLSLALKVVSINQAELLYQVSEANGEEFEATLEQALKANTNLSDITGITITYSDELVEALANDSFEVDGEYNVTYTIDGLDATRYYKTVTVKITEDEEESTEETSTEETSTEETSTEETSEGETSEGETSEESGN